MVLVLCITALSSLLLFNVGVDVGGDDSAYVIRAMRFLHLGDFPNFQGAIYPIVLSPFYALFNGNLIVLKALSILFMLGAQLFIFKTFRNTLPFHLLFFVLLFFSYNAYWLYYASLTYSEAFFSMLQFIAFYVFYTTSIQRKTSYKWLFINALFTLLLIKTRSIGAVFGLSVFLYFLWHKKFKTALTFMGFLLLLVAAWSLLVGIFFHLKTISFSDHFQGLILKNPYDKTQGAVTLIELFDRFINNINYYSSRHLLQMLNLRKTGILEANSILSILIWVSFIVLFVWNRNKNKLIFFVGIYTAIALGVVFSVPVMWDQSRFLQPYLPLFFIFFVYHLNQILPTRFKWIFIPAFTALLILQGVNTYGEFSTNWTKIKAYYNNKEYVGYTPDWANYFQASEWIAKQNLEEGATVGCRKPNISAVLSQKDIFKGIYCVPQYKMETALNILNNCKDRHIFIDYSKIAGKSLYTQVIDALNKDCSGGCFDGDDPTTIRLYNIKQDSVLFDLFKRTDKKYKFIVNQDSLRNYHSNYSVFLCDSLLQKLKRNNVQYLMQSNIRAISTKKTKYTLSSVRNYKLFIEVKYPKIFQKIHQIGADDGEPVVIYKINYNELGSNVAVKTNTSNIPSFSSALQSVCNTLQTNEKIACAESGEVNLPNDKNVLHEINTIPVMNYKTFSDIVISHENQFVLLNIKGLQPKDIPNDLLAALHSSFEGYVFSNNATYKLHYCGKNTIINREIKKGGLLEPYVYDIKKMEQMDENTKKKFKAVLPQLLLFELRDKNIRYLLTSSENGKDDVVAKYIKLVNVKFPNAFEKLASNMNDKNVLVEMYKVK